MKLLNFLTTLLDLIRQFIFKDSDLLTRRRLLDRNVSVISINHPWPPISPQRENNTKFDIKLRSKAQPNGCICKKLDQFFNEPCTQPQLDVGCVTQTSESYVWGLTRFQQFSYVVCNHIIP